MHPNKLSHFSPTLFFCFTTLCSALAAEPKAAPPEKIWKTNRDAGEKAFQKMNYAEAYNLFFGALIAAREFAENDPRIADSLDDIAAVQFYSENYSAAEPLYAEALELREKRFGTNSTEAARSCVQLAEVKGFLKQYAEAEKLCLRAQAIGESKLGAFHPWVGVVLAELANLYLLQEKLPEAEATYQKALKIVESTHTKIGFAPGSFRLRRSTLKPDFLTVAWILDDLALLYDQQGKLEQARGCYKKSLQDSEWMVGKDSVNLLTTLSHFAGFEARHENPGDAQILFKRALAIEEKNFGKNHPSLLPTLRAYAAVLAKLNLPAEAAAMQKRAQTISNSTKKEN